jgi:hypothetical protein
MPPMPTLPPRLFSDAVPFDPTGSQTLSAFASPFGAFFGDTVSAQAVQQLGGDPAQNAQVLAHAGAAQNPQNAQGDPRNAVGGLVFDATYAAVWRDNQIARRLAQAESSTIAAQQRLQSDVNQIEGYNAAAHRENAKALDVLSAVTGQSLGEDREGWSKWWTDQQGYAFKATPTTNKPTFFQDVPLDISYIPRSSNSCFAAGTLVRTLSGTRAIETLQLGDQVLTQDPRSGELGFRPILVVYHNPPSQVLRIGLDDETISATGIHRFWKAGKGWTMARELKPGDLIRTVGGLAKVASVETGSVQPVFNLDVGDNHSFFVGQGGALVHDNSVVRPVLHPFDAGPTLAAASDHRAN